MYIVFNNMVLWRACYYAPMKTVVWSMFARRFTTICSCSVGVHRHNTSLLKFTFRLGKVFKNNVVIRNKAITLGITSAMAYWLLKIRLVNDKNGGYFVWKALCEEQILPSKQTVQRLISLESRQRSMFEKIVSLVSLLVRFLQICLVFGPILFLYPVTTISRRLYKMWLRHLFRAVEFSGPAFIKLGQWSSTRRDLFSREFCDQFSQLHHHVRPHKWKFTEKALCRAYGKRWHDIIKIAKNQEPLGSGCIAQVYKGYIHIRKASEILCTKEKPGEKVKSSEEKEILESYAVIADRVPVAVKVLHPDIREKFGRDLSLMRVMSKILEVFIPSLRWVNLAECVKEFSIAMTKQMNMVHEARCLKQFREEFSKFQCIRFPLPILDLTHEDILVESFEEGQPLSDFIDENVDTPLKLKKQIADIGTDALFHMVFVKNFVHGDLHPGNILVQNAAEYSKEAVGVVAVKRPLRLVFLDCGITASLGEADREKFVQVFTAVVKGEGELVADLFLQKSEHVECVDPDTFRKDMADIVNSARETALQLSKFKVSQLLSDLFSLLSKHRVKMESNFATIIIAIAIVEGIGRSLDPELDILSKAKHVLLGEFIKFKHHV